MLPSTSLSLLATSVVLAVLACTFAGRTMNTCKKNKCYDGLFVRENDTWSKTKLLQEGVVVFNKLYNLSTFDVMAEYNESCGVCYSSSNGGVKLQDCSTDTSSATTSVNPDPTTGPLIRKRSPSSCQACCTTTMSFAVPGNVTDVISGDKFPAKHFDTATQLINVGHCASVSAPCGFGGSCEQAFRIHYILVTTNSGQDTFVPTSIPSHCTCIYT